MSESKGYVYVLSNPSMPGLVKVGKSGRGGCDRANELYTTGVPAPFVVEFEILVDDYSSVELLAHEELQDRRFSSQREFFRVDVDNAIDGVIRAYGRNNGMAYEHEEFCVSSEDIAFIEYGLREKGEIETEYPPEMAAAIGHVLAANPEITKQILIEYRKHREIMDKQARRFNNQKIVELPLNDKAQQMGE